MEAEEAIPRETSDQAIHRMERMEKVFRRLVVLMGALAIAALATFVLYSLSVTGTVLQEIIVRLEEIDRQHRQLHP